jgi:mono/diheme cytochrome c family protein
MDGFFWQRLHGGSTHLPIVLLPLSVMLDFVASRSREAVLRRGFHIAGFATALAGTLGGCAAVLAGLAMTHGDFLGSGEEKSHHLFVWPGFIISSVLVAGRLFPRLQASPRALRTYLVGMGIASALMLGAGYWGGEMVLHPAAENPAATSISSPNESAEVMRGHELFMLNCAHCHGDDARGTDDAPDLTKLQKSEARIAAVVRNGIKGEMPRFNQKLTDADVKMLIRFIRSLNRRAT